MTWRVFQIALRQLSLGMQLETLKIHCGILEKTAIHGFDYGLVGSILERLWCMSVPYSSDIYTHKLRARLCHPPPASLVIDLRDPMMFDDAFTSFLEMRVISYVTGQAILLAISRRSSLSIEYRRELLYIMPVSY